MLYVLPLLSLILFVALLDLIRCIRSLHRTYAMVSPRSPSWHTRTTPSLLKSSNPHDGPLSFAMLAFICIFTWPCMPPRLLPFDVFGYVDTLHAGKAASIWTTKKVCMSKNACATVLRRSVVSEPVGRVPEPAFRLQLRGVSPIKQSAVRS